MSPRADGQPIADLFEEKLLELIDQFRLTGISVAETVGTLAIIQQRIIKEAYERTNDKDEEAS